MKTIRDTYIDTPPIQRDRSDDPYLLKLLHDLSGAMELIAAKIRQLCEDFFHTFTRKLNDIKQQQSFVAMKRLLDVNPRSGQFLVVNDIWSLVKYWDQRSVILYDMADKMVNKKYYDIRGMDMDLIRFEQFREDTEKKLESLQKREVRISFDRYYEFVSREATGSGEVRGILRDIMKRQDLANSKVKYMLTKMDVSEDKRLLDYKKNIIEKVFTSIGRAIGSFMKFMVIAISAIF